MTLWSLLKVKHAEENLKRTLLTEFVEDPSSTFWELAMTKEDLWPLTILFISSVTKDNMHYYWPKETYITNLRRIRPVEIVITNLQCQYPRWPLNAILFIWSVSKVNMHIYITDGGKATCQIINDSFTDKNSDNKLYLSKLTNRNSNNKL